MAKSRVKSKPKGMAADNGAVGLDAVLEIVRTTWASTDGRPEQGRLRQQIANEVRKLKKTVESSLASTGKEKADDESLFSGLDAEGPKPPPTAKRVAEVSRFPEAALRVCAKDLADHALAVLPKAADFHDLASYRDYLSAKLPFNAVATRRRNANYLLNRFFPGGVLFHDLKTFAGAAAGHPALADALFYLTCRTERIVGMVAESVVWPSLPAGGVPRSRIADFVMEQFPGSKRAWQMSSAIIRTFTAYGIAKADRTRLSVAVRRGHLAAFAYILHLECPEPGMFSFNKLLDGPMHKWLLWDKTWITEQLYLLRHAGLLPKVSEIDNLRQFTTKYPLNEAVDRIVPLLREGRP